MQLEKHYTTRIGWVRAAVLGANDGIISTSSLSIGIAAAQAAQSEILLATVAGLVAGALSMAAGEYVSVSSQSDIEHADLAREKMELEKMPDVELNELAKIYIKRGLDPQLAHEVAVQLTEHDALGAHARDELGINEISQAQPLVAAGASFLSFALGGLLPLLVCLFAPATQLVPYLYGFAIVFLILLGYLSAYTGGSNVSKAIIRVTLWGTIAMGVTAAVGKIFGVNV